MISFLKNNLRAISWAFYDFANTIYSMNIITLYFALWVTVDKGGEDILYSIAYSTSLILSAFLEPILGAYSDSVGQKKSLMSFFTVTCCVFTALIGVLDSLYAGLLFFIIANLSYQLASVFYTALLKNVSDHSNVGRISGLGVGLGYVGSIVGLLMVKPFVNAYGRQGAFVPTAVLFFVFTIPCLIFVQEEIRKKISFRFKTVWVNSIGRIKETFAQCQKKPALIKLSWAGLVLLSAVNTIILFMGVYTKKVMGFTQDEIIFYFIICTVFAIGSAFVFGMMADRLGTYKIFHLVLMSWIIGLTFVLLSVNKRLFWIAGSLIGISLSGTWVIGRVIIVSLFPREKLGEIFGLFGLLTKLSAVLGSLVWGTIVFSFASLGIYKYKIAVFVQVVFVLIALLIVRRIKQYLQ